MTIKDTLDAIADLYAVVANPNYPSSGGQYLKVFSRPKTELNLEDFPALVLALDWQHDHDFELHEGGGGHHNYWIAMYLFVGAKVTDLSELHQRIEPWPLLIVPPILSYVQSHPTVTSVAVNEPFLPYTVGFYPWGGGGDSYFGMRATVRFFDEM